MYYDLLARFSAAVEFLAPRLLRAEAAIAVVVLLVAGVVFSWLFAGVAVLALYFLFALWLANRLVERQQRGT